MRSRLISLFIVLSVLLLAPFFVFAQQQSACGQAAGTFAYPKKILYNAATAQLYVMNEFGVVTVLNEKDLSVALNVETTRGLAKDFALNSKTGKLYVIDNQNSSVRIFDTAGIRSAGTIKIPSKDTTELFQITLDENKNLIYLLDRLGARFLVADGSANTVIKQYTIAYASAFWVNYSTNKVYFRSQGIGGIQELDLTTGRLLNIATGPRPNDLAIDTVNNRVLVVDQQARNLTAVDLKTRGIFKRVDVSLVGAPRFIAVSEKLNLAAVTCLTNNLAFYDLNNLNLVKHLVLPEGSQPERVFFDETRKLAYVPNFVSSVISVVDLNTFQIIRNVPAGVLHDNIFFAHNFLMREGVITPNGNFYLTYPYSHNISRLTPSGDITFVGGFSKDDPLLNHCPANNPVFANPNFMVFNGDNSKIYVANKGRFVTVLDAIKDEPIRKIDLKFSATNIQYNPKFDRVFVSHITDNSISVIDAKKDEIIKKIKTGVRPRQIIANTITGDMYVLTPLSNAISVIGSDLTASEIKLDSEPISARFDAASAKLFVTTFNSGFVIDGKTNKIIKTIPEFKNGSVSTASGKIIFSNSFDNYFTVMDTVTLEARKISFENPYNFVYNEPAKTLFVLDFFDTKIGAFDNNFSLIGSFPTANIAKNYGTTFLAGSDRYVYRLDDPNGVIQVIDPQKLSVSEASPLVKTIPFKYAQVGNNPAPISYFLADSKNDKLYVSSSPYSLVTVLYLADISKFSAKVIAGRFPLTFVQIIIDFVKNYWWAVLIAIVAVVFAVYYLIKRVKEAAGPPAPSIAVPPKV